MRASLELCWVLALGVVLAACSSLAVHIPFLRRYEPVEYDLDLLSQQHRRLARSTEPDRSLNLQFITLHRSFDLVLFPDTSIFHKHAKISTSSGQVDGSHLHTSTYTGYDRNTPGSHVHGNMISGVFDGTVYTDNEIYYIEPAHRYTRDTTHHSIVYRHSDLDKEALQGARCGLSDSSIANQLDKTRRILTGAESLRSKRQSSRNRTRVRCDLNMTGDFKFFEEVTRNVDGTNEVKVSVATSLLVSYVQGASRIFQNTNFDDDAATTDNIQFGIRAINIENIPSLSPFNSEFIGVEAFLRFHSDETTDQLEKGFCLSYRFTFRDFDGGVLGLAYVASIGAAGGICQNTLNTGIVTLLNYNQRVPSPVTVLTLAHEAGHNFGSEHDPETDLCSPSEGKYIMYAFANSGGQDNNNDFSPCSRGMMDEIIADRGQDDSLDCFKSADDLCENGFLDDGEECDCGIDYDGSGICTGDSCCMGETCELIPTAACSPDQGPCCDPTTCQFDPVTEQCTSETECADEAFCSGISASCPESQAKVADPALGYILCNGNTSTCVGNVCNGSFCVVLNNISCDCSAVEQLCDVCCEVEAGCTSTIEIATQGGDLAAMLPGGVGQRLPVGAPCNDFRGYCDALNNCFEVDSEGALDRLAGIIFDSQQIDDVVRWIRERWWAVLAAGVGLLIGMFVLILIIHLLLPRPEHVKNRAQRRQTIRRNRKNPPAHPDGRGHGGHEMRVRQ